MPLKTASSSYKPHSIALTKQASVKHARELTIKITTIRSHFNYKSKTCVWVESPKGSSPSGAHRSVRETLASYGSSYSSPFEYTKSQCTNIFGRLSRQRLSQDQACRLCPLSRLYLFLAQRPSLKSILTIKRFNVSG